MESLFAKGIKVGDEGDDTKSAELFTFRDNERFKKPHDRDCGNASTVL